MIQSNFILLNTKYLQITPPPPPQASCKWYQIFAFNKGCRRGEYFTHRDADNSSGMALADLTHGVLEEFDSLESIEAVLMDNMVSNTGFKGGKLLN